MKRSRRSIICTMNLAAEAILFLILQDNSILKTKKKKKFQKYLNK